MICLELKLWVISIFPVPKTRKELCDLSKGLRGGRETCVLGRKADLGKMLERRENFKEVNLRFLETEELREQIRTETTHY